MRNRRFVVACLFTVGAGFAAVAAAGCYDTLSDPAFFLQEHPSTTGTGGSGGTTTNPPECIPSNISSPVDDTCGVFVSSSMGKDSNAGTAKGAAVATLKKAIEIATAKGKPIYACAESFTEALALKDDATFYGGLDCTKGWTHVGPAKKTTWTAKADVMPVHVLAGARIAMEDVAIVAVDATVAGGSSIGVLAEAGTQIELAHCDVSAGAGAAGVDGAAFDMPAMSGAEGNAGGEACSATMIFGGGEVVNACDPDDAADDSIGGAGGIGQQASGGDGSDGQPGSHANGGKGEGADVCVDGSAGDDGAAGTSGIGATGPGSIGPGGYTGVSGGDGKKGSAAQGGGGGGGTKGIVTCAAEMMKGGASGGSGGSGGCPGQGGKGGQAGGSSFAIVSLGAKLLFANVSLTTAHGGKGGDGATGQTGGTGGGGGKGGSAKDQPATILGCGGGPGGKGGDGGQGGGGQGGHSIGLAFTGDAPDVKGATITIGAAGDGGTGDGATGDGTNGSAASTQKF